jgi:ABC-type arginine transport system permease subunit
LEAVPGGQLEAARVLGLGDLQVLALVRGPQALRLALAPITNDFVALAEGLLVGLGGGKICVSLVIREPSAARKSDQAGPTRA